jgi:uncharacterized protein (DUF2147 family)
MKQYKKWGFVVSALTLWSIALLATAGTLSPAGRWETLDDRSGKPRSIIEIDNINGVLQGKIVETLLIPGTPKPLSVCVRCKGTRKNVPIIGMTVLWGLTQRQSGGSWGGGKILDPRTGEIYSCKIKLSADGKKLSVRGYLGVSMLGRTQTWVRVSRGE